MTNLTVVAKVFSNTLIFLQNAMQKLLTFFQQNISMHLPYFQTESLTSQLSFEQLPQITLPKTCYKLILKVFLAKL